MSMCALSPPKTTVNLNQPQTLTHSLTFNPRGLKPTDCRHPSAVRSRQLPSERERREATGPVNDGGHHPSCLLFPLCANGLILKDKPVSLFHPVTAPTAHCPYILL